MFGRSRFLSFPLVIGAVIIGVVSGKAIFGPPLEEYWKKRLQEDTAAKETDVQQVHHESPGGHDALLVVESEGFPYYSYQTNFNYGQLSLATFK